MEQRRELPVALRVFVKRRPSLALAGIIYFVGLSPAIIGLAGYLPWPLSWWAAMGAVVGAVTVGPTAFLLARARGLLMAGYDPADLGEAFRREVARLRQERIAEYSRLASSHEYLKRYLATGGAAVGLTVTVAGVLAAPLLLVEDRWQQVLNPLLAAGAFIGIAVGGFLCVTWLNQRIDLGVRFWSWLWQGPIGRALFGLARHIVSRRARPSPQTHQPTELALGGAVEHLFLALPADSQERLREVLETVRRLEGEAQRQRHGMDMATGDAEREVMQRQLAESVAALEMVRLNLLRLHARSASIEGVTADLLQADEAAGAVDLLAAAHAELAHDPAFGRISERT